MATVGRLNLLLSANPSQLDRDLSAAESKLKKFASNAASAMRGTASTIARDFARASGGGFGGGGRAGGGGFDRSFGQVRDFNRIGPTPEPFLSGRGLSGAMDPTLTSNTAAAKLAARFGGAAGGLPKAPPGQMNTAAAKIAQLGKTATAGIGNLQVPQKGFVGATLSRMFEGINESMTMAILKANLLSAAFVALGSTLTSVITGGAAFEQMMTRVQVATGVGADQMTGLSQKIRDIGVSGVATAQDTAVAARALSMSGFTKAEVEGLVEPISKLALVSMESPVAAGEAFTVLVKGMGVAAQDYSKTADMLAKADQMAVGGLKDLQEGLKFVIPAAKTAGMSMEDLLTDMVLLSHGGLKGEVGATALRGTIVREADQTEEARNMMKALGLSFRDAQGNVKPLEKSLGELNKAMEGWGSAAKLDVVTTLWGQRAATGVMTLLDKLEKADEVRKEMANSQGTLDKASAAIMDTTAGKLAAISGQWTEIKQKIFDIVSGPLSDLLAGVKGFLDLLPKAAEGFGLFGKMLGGDIDETSIVGKWKKAGEDAREAFNNEITKAFPHFKEEMEKRRGEGVTDWLKGIANTENMRKTPDAQRAAAKQFGFDLPEAPVPEPPDDSAWGKMAGVFADANKKLEEFTQPGKLDAMKKTAEVMKGIQDLVVFPGDKAALAPADVDVAKITETFKGLTEMNKVLDTNSTKARQSEAASKDLYFAHQQGLSVMQRATMGLAQTSEEMNQAAKLENWKKMLDDMAQTLPPDAEVLKESFKEYEKASAAFKQVLVANARVQLFDKGLKFFEQTRTPLEKLNTDLTELRELLVLGAVDWGTFNRASAEAAKNFAAAGPKTDWSAGKALDRGDAETVSFLHRIGSPETSEAAKTNQILGQNKVIALEQLREQQRMREALENEPQGDRL